MCAVVVFVQWCVQQCVCAVVRVVSAIKDLIYREVENGGLRRAHAMAASWEQSANSATDEIEAQQVPESFVAVVVLLFLCCRCCGCVAAVCYCGSVLVLLLCWCCSDVGAGVVVTLVLVLSW